MTEAQQHPLEPALAARVDRYLDDLGRMLATASPVDRADALGSVREHLDDALASLGRPATDDDITAILSQLGTPEDVAAGLLESGIVDATPPAQPAPRPTREPGDNSAVGSLVAGIAALLLPFIGVAFGAVAIILGRSARRDGTSRGGSATAGMWLGGIAIALNVLVVLGLVGTMTLRSSGANETTSQEIVLQDEN